MFKWTKIRFWTLVVKSTQHRMVHRLYTQPPPTELLDLLTFRPTAVSELYASCYFVLFEGWVTGCPTKHDSWI